jgi:hypothetical protein
MDASSLDWFSNGTIYHLHVAIDDSTGCLTGLYLDYQETLKGYHNVLYQTLTGFGIPAMIYTDKRTVFEYKRKGKADDSEDTMTQFAMACADLGIEIKTTSVAQAKGRVERVNQTLQSRLPVEFRMNNIKTVEEANQFLLSYMDEFNQQFALQFKKGQSVFEEAPDEEKIHQILSVRVDRNIDQGHCIKLKNKYYIAVNELGEDVYLRPKMTVRTITTFVGDLYILTDNSIYATRQIEDHKAFSEQFDLPPKEDKKPEPKKWIPPKDHPWRRYNKKV